MSRPFIIENRPGGGGNIAAEAVVRAPADGYTLIMVSSANAINATLYDKLNFDFIRDIAPIARINHSTYVLAVHPSFSGKDGQYGLRRHRIPATYGRPASCSR